MELEEKKELEEKEMKQELIEDSPLEIPLETKDDTIKSENEIQPENEVNSEESQVIFSEDAQIEEPITVKETKWETIRGYLNELFMGVKYIIQNPYVFSLVAIKATFIVNYIMMDFLMIKFADGKFKIGSNPSTMLGLTKGLIGFSAGFTPVLVERLFKPSVAKMRFILFSTSLLSFISFFLLFWSPNVVVYLIGIFLAGPVIGKFEIC
jgi:hypothetical protein